MTAPWLSGLLSARVYDLEQPRFAGMPIHPVHKPGYFYALHRRHRDTYKPTVLGPRSGASRRLQSGDDGTGSDRVHPAGANMFDVSRG